MKDEIPRLDMVLPYPAHPALGRQKQVGLCELEDDLIYIVSSRPAEPWLHCEAVSFKRRRGGREDQDEKEKEEEGGERRKKK